MYHGMNTPCLTCHQKNDTYLENQLHSLYMDLIHRIEPEKNYRERFTWYNNIRCKYGIQCQELHTYNNRLNRLCEELEPYLIAVAKSKDENTIELLQICLRTLRGNYPNIYNQLEHMYNINHL